MTLVERIAAEASLIPEQAQRQLLDFAMFLKQKENEAIEADMDKIIEDNLPALKELAK